MIKKIRIINISSFLILLFCVGCLAHLSKENDFKPVTNQTYRSTCGGLSFSLSARVASCCLLGKNHQPIE